MTELPAETPEFIVVEGPIGVGKTSLVNRLAASAISTRHHWR